MSGFGEVPIATMKQSHGISQIAFGSSSGETGTGLRLPEASGSPNYGAVKAIKVQKQKLGEPDASGRRKPVPVSPEEDPNAIYEIPCDCFIVAIGTSPNPLIKQTTPGIETNPHGCLIVNEETNETTKDGVFAGGDAVTGAATVILAMGAGRKGAKYIDEYIKNKA